MTPHYAAQQKVRLSWLLIIILASVLIGCGTGPLFFNENGSSNPPSGSSQNSSSNPPLSASSHTVSLSWRPSKSGDVIGYNVYRSVQPGNYGLVSSMEKGTGFFDTTVQAGNTYYYVVTAVNSAGIESPYSEPAKATVAP